MRRSVYLDSLGILVNAVLFRVLVEIENQEDISEEASHRLNDLCKMLHTVEDLFPATSTGMAEEGGESSVALHVRIWFKFKFLSELLEASMVSPHFSALSDGGRKLSGILCVGRRTSCSSTRTATSLTSRRQS